MEYRCLRKEVSLSEEELQILRTCALLHDIGKPECWANKKPWSEHIHWTYKFVKACLGEEFAQISMRHHIGRSYPSEYHPQSELEEVICLADNFASGADRREKPEHGVPYPKPPIVLTHVLSRGDVVRSSYDEARLAYVSKTLQQKVKEIGNNFREKPLEVYRKVFDLLECSELNGIPADTRSPVNDVSLWNHLKLTAAFATCIWLDGGYKGGNYRGYSFAVLCGDADRVSSYINTSRRLPDLSARSEKVKKATGKVRDLLADLLGPECVIFAGGGSFLALSSTGKAEVALSRVKRGFEGVTGGDVTITVNSIVANGEEIMNNFGNVWQRAQYEMRIKKGEREALFPKPIEEGMNACDVCHIRPGVFEDRFKMLPIDAVPRPERLCENCLRLRAEGKGVELDDLKDRTNFVASLRADGDDMGKVLRGDKFKELGKANTPSRLSALSDLIHLVCEKKLESVVQRFGGRMVFAGGDDVLAFIPGEKALEAAGVLASSFKSELAGKCTMSVGVAIFRYDLPVYVGLETASYLLKRAKEENKNKVAYSVVSGSGATLVELKEVLPRSWDDLNTLLRVVEFMSNGGTASLQIRRVARLAKENPERAEVFIKYLMGRKIIRWREGEKFLKFLKLGLLSDAFVIYNLFRGM